MNKQELCIELEKLGIDYKPSMRKTELEELLKSAITKEVDEIFLNEATEEKTEGKHIGKVYKTKTRARYKIIGTVNKSEKE